MPEPKRKINPKYLNVAQAICKKCEQQLKPLDDCLKYSFKFYDNFSYCLCNDTDEGILIHKGSIYYRLSEDAKVRNTLYTEEQASAFEYAIAWYVSERKTILAQIKTLVERQNAVNEIYNQIRTSKNPKFHYYEQD